MDNLTFMFQLFATQSPEEMLALCISVDVSANHGYVKTLISLSSNFTFIYILVRFGHKTTWFRFRRDHVLA